MRIDLDTPLFLLPSSLSLSSNLGVWSCSCDAGNTKTSIFLPCLRPLCTCSESSDHVPIIIIISHLRAGREAMPYHGNRITGRVAHHLEQWLTISLARRHKKPELAAFLLHYLAGANRMSSAWHHDSHDGVLRAGILGAASPDLYSSDHLSCQSYSRTVQSPAAAATTAAAARSAASFPLLLLLLLLRRKIWCRHPTRPARHASQHCSF